MGEGPSGAGLPVKLLLAVFDEQDEWQGEPLGEALVRVLEGHGVAGATLLAGITGYGAHRGVHRRGLIGLPHDRPNALLVVDLESTLREVLPAIRPMIAQGLVVLLDAELIR
jgi:PII-like signaling protein